MSDNPHPMTGFDPKWTTPPEYILGITRDIWENRGVEELDHLYASDIPVRFPAGSTVGNQPVIDGTWATLAEFPDRQLLGEDVIWSDDGAGGFLSSHRITSTATHLGDGAFGPASGTRLIFRTIADCAARENSIYDEWLVRDIGAMVRQLGSTPEAFAAAQIVAEGGASEASAPSTPHTMPPDVYTGRGNQHRGGRRYADLLRRVSGGDTEIIEQEWDRAATVEMPGGITAFGWDAVAAFWQSFRMALPDAELTIEHQIGRSDLLLGERAALRWWLSGTHTGDGMFGEPTGVPVHVMGISHAEFGPWGIRREWLVLDEVAVWKQILLGR